MSTDAAQKPLRLPRSTWFIVSTEACERMSFYGVQSILTNYLQFQLVMTDKQAKEVSHLWITAVYFLPLLGGWIADKFIGRYWTILSLSLFYCLGHGTLALMEGRAWGIYVGLALIALGAGGIKPCVSAFVADQFDSLDERSLAKIYGIFYWAINLGAALAFGLIPAVAGTYTDVLVDGKIQTQFHEHWGYGWAFGIPGIFMAVAALIFWLGTPLYVRRQSQIQSDAGIDPLQRTEDRRTLLRIVFVLSPLIIFWALYNQLNTSWVQQGNAMQSYEFFGYTVDAQSIQAASAALILILVPFMGFVGYPFLRRIGLPTTVVAKMTMGMVVTAFSFVVSGIIQHYIDHLETGTKISVLWQLVPYVPLEIGEVMVSVTGLEFAYGFAPARMKSVVMSVWFLTNSLGNFLVFLLTWIDERYLHLTPFQSFNFYAILMLFGAGAFVLIAKALMKASSPEVIMAAPIIADSTLGEMPP